MYLTLIRSNLTPFCLTIIVTELRVIVEIFKFINRPVHKINIFAKKLTVHLVFTAIF